MTAETDKLGRAAAIAEGEYQAAVSLRDVVLLAVRNFERRAGEGESEQRDAIAALRRTLEQTLETLVAGYRGKHRQGVNRFVAAVQARLLEQEYPQRARKQAAR